MKMMKKIPLKSHKSIWGFSLFILLMKSQDSFAYTIQSFEKKVKNSYQINSLAEKLPRKELEEKLRSFLLKSRPNRVPGTTGHKKAQDYLKTELSKLKSTGSQLQQFEFQHSNAEIEIKSVGTNIVWEKKGKDFPNEMIIITANYDTIVKDKKTGKYLSNGEMPGADNNASGVTILLSMAELFDQLELPRSVKLVFLDFEEYDSMGSIEFAKNLMADIGLTRIVGVMNLTTLAHDTKTSDLDKKFNNFLAYTASNSNKNYEIDSQFAKSILPTANKLNSQIKFQLTERNSEDSLVRDSASSFRGYGLGAITFTHNDKVDKNPRLNSSNDFVETLNFSTYNNVYRYLTGAVLAWNYGIVK